MYHLESVAITWEVFRRRVKVHGLRQQKQSQEGEAAPSCTSHSPAAAGFPSRAGEKLFALNSKGKLIYCHAFYNPPQWGRLLNEQHYRSEENTSTSFILFTLVLKQVQGSHACKFNLWKHNFTAAVQAYLHMKKRQPFCWGLVFKKREYLDLLSVI